MPQFIISYHGGKHPETDAARQAHFGKWKDWVAGMGATAVNPGTPLGPVTVLGANDTAVNAMSGFTTVEVDTLEAALEIARACPFLDLEDATLHVAEAKSMG